MTPCIYRIRRRARALSLALPVALLIAAPTVAAPQLTGRTDAVTAARSLFDLGALPARAASELRRTHLHDLATTTAAMVAVGYHPGDVAGAARLEFGAGAWQLWGALRSAGLPSTAVRDAFTRARIPVTLDCFEPPNGTPVPCGGFGGDPETPITGQVSWSPVNRGYTDSTLTITATNLPPLSVRIGSRMLALESVTSQAVVARLPGSPVAGELVIRRTSDQVEARLENTYRVEAPPPPWAALAQAAINGAIVDARTWLAGAHIVAGKCVVIGATATGAPGVFASTAGFGANIRNHLTAAGANTALAQAWEGAWRAAWEDWATQVRIPALPWYPTFALWPGDKAPPTDNVPLPLTALPSLGVESLMPQGLGQRVAAALLTVVPLDPAATEAIAAFSAALGGRFAAFLPVALVMHVKGSGNVPGYNPPLVSAGPVAGVCSGLNVLGAMASAF